MASEKTLKVTAGSATIVSFGASAAYFVWMFRGGSLVGSLLSIFPAWKSMDPIPVLESFENSRKRRKDRAVRDEESLESLVEESNKTAQDAKETKDQKTANTEGRCDELDTGPSKNSLRSVCC